EAETDRHMAGSQIDQAPRDKEGADTARTLFMQRHGSIIDAPNAANARTDQDASALLFFLGLGLDASVLNGLRGSSHGVDDEIVYLALLLALHPLVGIVLAIGIVSQRQTVSDLTGDIIDLNVVDTLGSTLACQNVGPGGLHSATKGRDKPHSGDDDSAQFHVSTLSVQLSWWPWSGRQLHRRRSGWTRRHRRGSQPRILPRTPSPAQPGPANPHPDRR